MHRHGVWRRRGAFAACRHPDDCSARGSAAPRVSHGRFSHCSAGLGEYISGTILFEETLYDHASDGTPFVEVCKKQGIVPGIKTDQGLVPLVNSNNESWTQGLTKLADRSAKYYEAVRACCGIR